MIRLQFHGAAGEVTGSCLLVRTPGCRFLVDCGMFQGGRDAEYKNRAALSFDLQSLDFVLLTHAHIDHSGLLPRLYMLGYRGPVYVTAASRDLLEILLLDSAHIQEKEAEWVLRHRHGRHGAQRASPQPLYSVTQAMETMKHLRPVAYGEVFAPHPSVSVRFLDAGHILGSAIIELKTAGKTLVFSGDLGQHGRPVMNDPTPLAHADALVVESTYGDRQHRSLAETERELVAALRHTLFEARGNVVIPAFAVGRTQELIYMLAALVRDGRLPPLRIYVDSPMAEAVTRLTIRHEALLDAATQALMVWQRAHPHLLDVRFVADFRESMALAEIQSGAVIISASGMCEAGRIKYHLRNNLPRPECAVLITGFQAAGTLGRRLVDGARNVRIFGEPVPVRARVHTIGGLSAHADRGALLTWLRGFRPPPAKTFVVHGEALSAQALARGIREELGWPGVEVPGMGSEWQL